MTVQHPATGRALPSRVKRNPDIVLQSIGNLPESVSRISREARPNACPRPLACLSVSRTGFPCSRPIRALRNGLSHYGMIFRHPSTSLPSKRTGRTGICSARRSGGARRKREKESQKKREKKVLSSLSQRFPVPKRTGLFFFSPLKFGSPPRLTRQAVLRLAGWSGQKDDHFQDVSTSRRERPRRSVSCACRALPLPPSPLPRLCASRPSPRACVPRAQSSYRETVASLRSEERGGGACLSTGAFMARNAYSMASWACSYAVTSCFPPPLVERVRAFQGPGRALVKKKRRPARHGGCFCSAGWAAGPPPLGPRTTSVQVGPAGHVLTIHVRSNRPRLLDFHPTWKRVSLLTTRPRNLGGSELKAPRWAWPDRKRPAKPRAPRLILQQTASAPLLHSTLLPRLGLTAAQPHSGPAVGLEPGHHPLFRRSVLVLDRHLGIRRWLEGQAILHPVADVVGQSLGPGQDNLEEL